MHLASRDACSGVVVTGMRPDDGKTAIASAAASAFQALSRQPRIGAERERPPFPPLPQHLTAESAV
jgi:hypothetical protein